MKTSVPLRQEITPRDIQVARWIARGKERNEVASILQTSRSAINRHMIKIMKTTGTRNGAQAVATLMALGLLTPSDVTDLGFPDRMAAARRIAPHLFTGAAQDRLPVPGPRRDPDAPRPPQQPGKDER